MPTIVSTASNSTEYCDWLPISPGQMPRKGRRVVINGGAGVMRKRGLVTPLGVTTIVSEDELSFLETVEAFRLHVERGYITVHSRKADGDAASRSMNCRDGASPMMPQDYIKPPKAEPAQAEIPSGPRPKKVSA